MPNRHETRSSTQLSIYTRIRSTRPRLTSSPPRLEASIINRTLLLDPLRVYSRNIRNMPSTNRLLNSTIISLTNRSTAFLANNFNTSINRRTPAIRPRNHILNIFTRLFRTTKIGNHVTILRNSSTRGLQIRRRKGSHFIL